MKRWKAGILILGAVVLVFVYIARVVYVNRNNGVTKVTYLSDDEPVTYNGLEITVEEEKLYDIAAFIDQYPQIQNYYKYEGSMYERYDDEEGLRATEYELVIKMNFNNVSGETKEIPLMNYEIYSDAYYNGINPYLIDELNQIGDSLELSPGESKSFLISYDLNRLSFRSDHYEQLLEQPFSILISGYPHIQNINLNHLEYVQADEEAQEVYERLASAGNSKVVSEIKDTEYGTLLELGELYVTNGITIKVEDCWAGRNVNDYPEYDSSAFSSERLQEIVQPDGSVAVYRELDGTLIEDKTYLVFVKLKYINTTEQVRNLSIYPFLHNYTGKKYFDISYTKWQGLEMDETEDSGKRLEAGETGYVTYGYYVRLDTDKWKFPDSALYLEFSGISSNKTDLRKGVVGWPNIFLRVQ